MTRCEACIFLAAAIALAEAHGKAREAARFRERAALHAKQAHGRGKITWPPAVAKQGRQ